MKGFRRLFLCAVCMALLAADAAADGTWYTFPSDSPPQDMGFLVNEYSGTVTLTFLGDCTLGGEAGSARKKNGFVQTVEAMGYDWPFLGLRSLTENDDLTVANLEGVLTDRTLTAASKEFCFSGKTAYTRILKLGSIECVTLANNHTMDFGKAGFSDTCQALQDAQIAFFGGDTLAVWEHEGILIGFAGVGGSLGTSCLEENVSLLREYGCDAVIVYMHAGREGTGTVIARQKSIARQAAALGCNLVVGSHPHVVQGWELVDGMPVVYSLGNCSFGGNHKPSDMDALVLQYELTFAEGELASAALRFWPISVSSTAARNDFSPRLLTGSSAERVLDKMRSSTGCEIPVFEEGSGAVIRLGSASETGRED